MSSSDVVVSRSGASTNGQVETDIEQSTVVSWTLDPHTFVVVTLDPPIRKGKTMYPHIVMQFETDYVFESTLVMNSDLYDTKYKDKLEPSYKDFVADKDDDGSPSDDSGEMTLMAVQVEVKTEGGLNASTSFVAKANPLNRAPHKRKSELHHALCNMLSNILAPLQMVEKTAVASVGGEELLLVTMRSRKDGLFPWFWRKLAVINFGHLELPDTSDDSLNIFAYQVQFLLSAYLLSYVDFVTGTDSDDARVEERVDSLTGAATL
ncbi:hypothetical protein Tco_0979735 [Tanacetum coccineum]